MMCPVLFSKLIRLILWVFKQWCFLVVGFFFQCRHWSRAGTTNEEMIANACIVLESKLEKFYKLRHQNDFDEQLTRIGTVTPKMMGVGGTGKLSTKGGETYTFVSSSRG